MNPAQLTIGTKVLLASGDRAEVVALNTEAETVYVRYLDALGEPHARDAAEGGKLAHRGDMLPKTVEVRVREPLR